MIRVGELELTALRDAEISFATMREAFGADDDSAWWVGIRAFVARSPSWVVLVDTGLGPPSADPGLPAGQGWLLGELARAGVDREAVTRVLLTHLHVDHVGWNMSAGALTFPNARYVAHRLDYDWIASTRSDRPYFHEQVQALYESGLLDLVEADTEVAAGVVLVHEPGHTPGHCVVSLASEGQRVLLLGDLAVHELQLRDPATGYDVEEDGATAAAARRRVLSQVADEPVLVGLGHLPGGLGRICRQDAGFRWEPAG